MSRFALITGAGRPGGLGQAIRLRLAQDGCDILFHKLGVVAGDVAHANGVGVADQLEATAQEIWAVTKTQVWNVSGDLLLAQATSDIVAAADTGFGRLDILVNNADVGYLFGPLIEMQSKHLYTVLGVNVRAPMILNKHAALLMIRGGRGGRIVNIASQAEKLGFASASAYTAFKHGIVGLTRAVALELSPQQITVSPVHRSHVTTGLAAWQNDFMAQARGESLDDCMVAMRARMPLGWTGLPKDTAASFLCSSNTDHVTAEALNVSGGEEYH